MCNKDFDLMKFRLQLYYALSQIMPQFLAYWCITMRQHDVYIPDLSMTLTFDLGGGDILREFY